MAAHCSSVEQTDAITDFTLALCVLRDMHSRNKHLGQ